MLEIDTHTSPLIQTDAYARHTQTRAPRLARHEPPERDTLHLSPAAEDAAAQEPRLREALVRRIRAEIDSGAYLTPEKLDIAAGELCQELRAGR